MKRARARIKARLMAEVEALIEECLDWHESVQAPDLMEIEEKVRELRKRVGERVAKELIEDQEERQPAGEVRCPRCGRKARYVGQREVMIESRVGEFKVERGYYYCEGCRRGFFPLDEQLRLWEGRWSEGVLKEAVWLAGLVSYKDAEGILREVGQIHMSQSTIWRKVQRYGGKMEWIQEREAERGMLLPRRWEPPRRGEGERVRMGVAMDGAMVCVREEGWKELKVGAVFEVEEEGGVDERIGEVIETGHAVANSYVAYLGGPEKFGKRMWAEARRRGWERAVDTEVVGDGAPWIWNLAATHFGFSQQVVDWYHAKEHLISAGYLLHGEGSQAARSWVKQREQTLYQGQIERLVSELKAQMKEHPKVASDLQREATYLHRNRRRMRYMEMREEGWVIGSGMVESAAKQYKARFAGPGMRWSRPGINRLLPVRTAIMSHRFDSLWTSAYTPNSPPT